MPRELILWGFHPAHCDGVPLKICAFTRKAQTTREREGWVCAAYAKGDDPTGLAALSRVMRYCPCGECGLDRSRWSRECVEQDAAARAELLRRGMAPKV